MATQTCTGRGMPFSLTSSVNGPLVSGMQYNSLGLPTQGSSRLAWSLSHNISLIIYVVGPAHFFGSAIFLLTK